MGLLDDIHAIAVADAQIATAAVKILGELSLLRQALEKLAGTEVTGIALTNSPPAPNQ